MQRRIRALVVGVVWVLSASGCAGSAPPTGWVKPGATPQTTSSDYYVCMKENAPQGRGATRADLWMALLAPNTMVKLCMEARGYTRQTVPTAPGPPPAAPSPTSPSPAATRPVAPPPTFQETMASLCRDFAQTAYQVARSREQGVSWMESRAWAHQTAQVEAWPQERLSTYEAIIDELYTHPATSADEVLERSFRACLALTGAVPPPQ